MARKRTAEEAELEIRLTMLWYAIEDIDRAGQNVENASEHLAGVRSNRRLYGYSRFLLGAIRAFDDKLTRLYNRTSRSLRDRTKRS